MPFATQTNKCPQASSRSRAFLFLLLMSSSVAAQKLATFAVTIDKGSDRLQIPVKASIHGITALPHSSLDLVRIDGQKRSSVPFQITDDRTLWWLVDGEAGEQQFELIEKKLQVADTPLMIAEKKDGALTLRSGKKHLLRYQFETMPAPPGVNDIFARSGFIHPLWSPKGQVLTRIQPPDHYHHYGIWNPWTHTLYRGDTVDFWNLNAKQGRVRFSEFLSTSSGNVFAEYAAVHEHVAFTRAEPAGEVAIREVQTVRVYAPDADDDQYIADITVELTCPEHPIRLLEYRYGGLGWRGTEHWTKENTRALTSEGKTRKDADGSLARWCIVEGTVDGQTAGAVMMSFPENYNHPEPLRIWPENANGNRGDMFANFSPTKNKDWSLEPGKTYTLRYRLIVFDGNLTQDDAEVQWQLFAKPPIVRDIK